MCMKSSIAGNNPHTDSFLFYYLKIRFGLKADVGNQPYLLPLFLWQILAYSVLSDFTSNTEMVKKGKHIIVQLFAPTPHKLPFRLPGAFTTSTNDTCACHHQFENCEIVVSASE